MRGSGSWLGRGLAALLTTCAVLAGCDNSPQPKGAAQTNTMFTAFQERSPRYLDPTASYANNETPITFQVYDPLYGYDYLQRPFKLVPKLAEEIAQPKFLDKNGQPLPDDAPGELVAESIYDVKIKHGVKYAPHPAFAKDDKGEYLYHNLTTADTEGKRSPWDFAKTGTRELVADDFVYALKRHTTPRIEAPIYGIFSEYVIGLKEYSTLIRAEDAKLRKGMDPASLDKPFLDFRKWPLAGATALDDHTLRIRVRGKYPQWKYWMAMPFIAPVPWEADKFYAQPGMAKNGLAMTRWPVGTGPYMLTEYEQDRRHVLTRNPNYRQDLYPCVGEPQDEAAGLLKDCGKPMPFIDKIVFTSEKEKVPYKAKFVQGYLDIPEVERVDWGPDFLADANDSDEVKKRYEDRGFQFPQTVDISIWYLGFNMLDPVVGKGATREEDEKHRKLRQAVSIAIDWEEGYGRIFIQKGGVAAHGPVPAGLFGSRHGTPEGYNPVTHKMVDGKVVRRSIDEAKQLLAEAGYPDGRDAKTGRPLVLNYDFQRAITPEFRAELDWMVKQFAKIGVQLEIRATDFNQYQDKTLKGKHQIFWAGWLADYPDAENFLFLLYGPNSKSKHEGENIANYDNPEYDKRYKQLQLLEDGPQKQKVIDEMVDIVRKDAVWSFGYYPYAAGAYQQWVHNGKPTIMIRDMVRYHRLDPALRAEKQAEWNHPVYWPLLLIVAALALLAWVARRGFVARERANALAGVATSPAKA